MKNELAAQQKELETAKNTLAEEKAQGEQQIADAKKTLAEKEIKEKQENLLKHKK